LFSRFVHPVAEINTEMKQVREREDSTCVRYEISCRKRKKVA
jgi:hypothetical protein